MGSDQLNIAFEVKKCSDNYTIIRLNGDYSQHAHIKSRKTCNMLLRLIKNNKLPRSEYLQGSCRRLLTEKEFEHLKPYKQMYYNVNRGVRI